MHQSSTSCVTKMAHCINDFKVTVTHASKAKCKIQFPTVCLKITVEGKVRARIVTREICLRRRRRGEKGGKGLKESLLHEIAIS